MYVLIVLYVLLVMLKKTEKQIINENKTNSESLIDRIKNYFFDDDDNVSNGHSHTSGSFASNLIDAK